MKKILTFILGLLIFTYARAGYPDGPIPITATETYMYSSGAAKALLYFNFANADRKLRKPLIIFEGFDPGIYTKPNEKEGRTKIQDFIDDIEDDKRNGVKSQLEVILRGDLDASPSIIQQYDIIYVNWKNGTDYIQNNALLAEEIIRWVNTNKIAVGSVIHPNVIMGKSMGSIIARMALKRMEDRFTVTGKKHNTRLYVSLDGGMQGSNLPQGYQHLANHFRQLYIGTGPTALAVESGAGTINFISENIGWINKVGSPAAQLSVNHTPAARQLTINYVNTGQNVDNTVHASFVNELRNNGYPNGDGSTPFRKVAVSNGSECAKTQDVGSGGNLLTYYGRISPTFWATVLGGVDYAITNTFGGASYFGSIPVFSLSTLPGRNSFNFDIAVNAKENGVGNQVYKGKISYAKKRFGLINITATLTNKSYNANASTLAYDYFPGGNQDLATELPLPDATSNWLVTRAITFTHKRYCHVPVPSALDLGSGFVTLTQADYLTPYRGAIPPPTPKSTPFTQGFITAFNGQPDNEPHATIVRRNGDWIANELNQVSPNVSASCAILCGAAISGDGLVCGSRTFTVPSVSGAVYTWSPLTSPYATITASGNSYTVVRNGTAKGAINVTLDITTPGCGSPFLTKVVNVGSNIGAAQFGGLPNPVCRNTNFNVYSTGAGYSHSWLVDGGTVTSGQGTTEAFINVSNSMMQNSISVTLQAYDGCGEAMPQVSHSATVNDCGGGGIISRIGGKQQGKKLGAMPADNAASRIKVLPNPAGSYFVVEVPEAYSGGSMRLLTLEGKAIGSQPLTGSVAKYNVATLAAGIYLLELVSTQGNVARQKVVVSR